MKGFDVLKVKSAVKSRNKFDLSRSHLTTMDFGQIVPLMVEETVPGDQFNVKGNYFSRMAPLVKPTYGKFSFKTVAGFVPYHQIADDADAWLAGKTTWEGQTTHHRYITVGDLADFIMTNCLAVSSSDADATNCDYTQINSNGSAAYYFFSSRGKYFVKVLNSLGYALPQGVDLRTSSTWYTDIRPIKLSAYPLLGFAKLYNDYMSQSQRFNIAPLSNFLYRVKHGIVYTNANTANGQITATGINIILSNCLLNYENGYFTSAWQNPNNPISGTESIRPSGLDTMAGTGADMYMDDRNNYLVTYAESSTSGDRSYISQRALDMLKNFDDWVRRNNYSGSRAVQQIYSRFGIKTDDYRSNYAHVISTDTLPIQVGDVTATAGTNFSLGQVTKDIGLGDYAGKGIMNGSDGFSYKADDYGILIVLGYYTVIPMNSFGYDRRVLRNTPLDYYNPEFDGMGADAISIGEVWENGTVSGSIDSTKMNAVFGYTERYNSYRYGRDVITGEFRDYHSNGDMNVWHTGRNLQGLRQSGNLVAQSSSMNTLPQVDSEYNRIFSVIDDDVDHFYLTAYFNVDAVRPMLSLNQVPRLGEGDTNVPRNGNVIS